MNRYTALYHASASIYVLRTVGKSSLRMLSSASWMRTCSVWAVAGDRSWRSEHLHQIFWNLSMSGGARIPSTHRANYAFGGLFCRERCPLRVHVSLQVPAASFGGHSINTSISSLSY